jgi:hypothetical protein
VESVDFTGRSATQCVAPCALVVLPACSRGFGNQATGKNLANPHETTERA